MQLVRRRGLRFSSRLLVAFDFDGKATYTGGTITVNGQTRTEITADGPGGGGPGGQGGFGGR